MGIVEAQTSLRAALETFFVAPVENPDLLPTVLPLILGAIVLELYFGKHSREELGWNTSVGNAIIWISTGLSLLMTSELAPLERNASYFLIGFGAFVAYMDFYHKWPATIAFMVSSAGLVYSLAYVTVIFVKTGLSINSTTLKAAAVFIVGVNVGFKLLQTFETSEDTFPR